jgi:hypothetical protein
VTAIDRQEEQGQGGPGSHTTTDGKKPIKPGLGHGIQHGHEDTANVKNIGHVHGNVYFIY